MAKLRILYVSSEVDPFLNTSQIASFVRNLPTAMQERGMEIRILVPRFGSINERKNRLHEVVRLSGITIPMGDEEKPLTIKVASIPACPDAWLWPKALLAALPRCFSLLPPVFPSPPADAGASGCRPGRPASIPTPLWLTRAGETAGTPGRL